MLYYLNIKQRKNINLNSYTSNMYTMKVLAKFSKLS